MIRIKPHHFFDIIKLYGKGIERFVPDEKYNHNFYGIANEIIGDHQVQIEITATADDICSPCKYSGAGGGCTDKIDPINDVESKDTWNKILDNRIIRYTKASESSRYTAHKYCEMLYSIKEHIHDVWKEESDSAKNFRYEAFCAGAQKYLGL